MTTKDYQERSALRIFLSYFKPHRGLFILDMICALMIALIVPTGYLWTKLGGLQVTMMVIYVVVLAGSILLSILPASVTRGLAHAANAIIAQRLWLVIAVLTTTVVAYGISYVIASRIFASREW